MSPSEAQGRATQQGRCRQFRLSRPLWHIEGFLRMRAAPIIRSMMLCEDLENGGKGLFTVFPPRPLEVQLVLLSADWTDYFATFFGGYAQNLHLLAPVAGISNDNGKVAARACR
jgi:hypothetical protein